jgi:hypothetical protein
MPTKKPVPERERLIIGVATKGTAKPSVRLPRSIQGIGEYNAGFDKGSEGVGNDRSQSFAWQHGWADAQEDKAMNDVALLGR